jgi:hypothetical protein
MTLSMTILSIATLCHYAECHCAECYILFMVMLNVIMSSVIMLNVAMLSVVAPYRGFGSWAVGLQNNSKSQFTSKKFFVELTQESVVLLQSCLCTNAYLTFLTQERQQLEY